MQSLKYKYSFDVTGKYSGLVYADEFGIFPKNCVHIKPDWFDGYVPYYNESRKQWSNVKRENCKAYELEFNGALELRREIENQTEVLKNIYGDLSSKLTMLEHSVKRVKGTWQDQHNDVMRNFYRLEADTKEAHEFVVVEFERIQEKLYVIQNKKNSLEMIGEFFLKIKRKITNFFLKL